MRLTIVLLLSSFCGAQVISGVALERVPPGNYVKSLPGSTIATCNSADTNSPCTQYVTTYTDQTLSNQCLGPAPGPTSGVGCANPGKADSDGNYTIFASAGVYKVCVSSPGTPVVINCATVGTGNGNSSSAGATSISVNPPSLPFGTVQTGSASPAQNVSINNTGTTTVTITGCSFVGTNFVITNPALCNNATLLAGATLVPQVTYNPTAAVTDNDVLTISSTVPPNPLNPATVALTGTGTASASFSVSFNCGGSTGSGTIVSNETPPTPLTINAVCTKGAISGLFANNFASGATPTFTATSTDGGTPSNISGGGCAANPCTPTIAATTNFSVSFTAPVPQYVLSISGIDQGIGTVASDLNDVLTGTPISCTSTAGVLSGKCSATFNQGQTPTLTETPSGSCTGGACTFVKWGGVNGCTTTSTCLVPALNMNVTASVDFVQPTGNGPLNRVQTGTTSTGTSNVKATLNSAQNAGDLLVCGAWWNDATTTVSGVTDLSGNSYTQVSASPKAASGQTTVMYYAANIAAAAAGANVVTFALNASPSSRQTHCVEFSGVLASPADGSAGATGTSTSVSAGSVTTTAAGDLLVGTTVVAGSITSVSAGWTQDILDSGSNDFEHTQVGVAGAYPFAPTQSPSSAFGSIMAAFKTGGGAPATFSVNIACGPSGSGTVTSPTGGLSTTCTNGVPSGTQSVSVNSGSPITLTATPAAGSSFSSYSGAGCGVSPSCVTQAITTNTVITANFALSGTQQFYIATTGNDSNAGTQASPWLTFNHANSALILGASGTTVNVASGTYNQCPILSRAGTASQPIKYVGAAAYGSVIVCASSGSFSSGVSLNTSSAWTTFSGFNISGSLLCEGAVVEGQNNTFSGNYVNAVGAPSTTCGGGGGGGAGILIGAGSATGCLNATVTGNIVEDIGPFPTASNFVHGIYAAACNGNIYNNIVSRTVGWGIQVNHSSVSPAFIYNVSNNVTMNTAKGGILIEDGDHHSVFNNIVVTAPVEHGIEENYGSTGANNTYRNNLLVQDLPTPWFFENGNRTTTGNLCDVVQAPYCAVQITAPQAVLSNIFTNYTGNAKTGTYTLKAGSVGINAGTNTGCAPGGTTTCVPNSNFSGTANPQGTNWNIGAY